MHLSSSLIAGVWSLLEPYDGDVLFLEDDLLVSPDFYQVLAEASRLKQSPNGTQVRDGACPLGVESRT